MAQRSMEVGVLGATGVVGQQFVSGSRAIRGSSPRGWRRVSDPKEGVRRRRAVEARRPMPDDAGAATVDACVPGRGPRVVFSGLDASVAGEIEQAFAAAGHFVVSNARNYRMDPLVPLLIPEVNADHLASLAEQQHAEGLEGRHRHQPELFDHRPGDGAGAAAAVRPRAVIVITMQAVSGAGYPGVPSLDILGNVVPFIGGEEEKIESETLKILGADGGRTPHPVTISAHTNRVAVIDGHIMTVSVDFERQPSSRRGPGGARTFRGRPQELGLPTRAEPADRRRSASPTGRSPGSTPTAATAWRSSSAACARAGHPHKVRRPGPQHGARRRRRGDPQRRADAAEGLFE